ncbi:related to conserved hypothetical Ustilaginaceae-specific protein [Melanopsichium pennsylvanicum]|uniref:Related to conserved hypothetical Ustilaginaceae-specific protein n=1 Tax=Melanopsichium pennsylvanicum TaxID=63383 RepID=A0AAJ4XKC0_9BASI|nr:related to conserved hypothetical Ustilaginaceae-specific protein [Melanopsichium pennsylvanicum]
MYAPTLFAPLINLLYLRLTASAGHINALFDRSPTGQTEWSRYCTLTGAPSNDLLPHACFTIRDDIVSAAHSSSHGMLGFASASGQDFVVVAPIAGHDSTVEFNASGFYFHIRFSDSINCAKVAVSAPVRAVRKTRREGEEAALEPILQDISCYPNEKKTFRL